jgi:hypothetical protein
MKTVMLDLITSKKFLAAIAAAIIWAGGRLGFDIDPMLLDRFFVALLLFVGAQGVADMGKGAAKVNAVAAVTIAASGAQQARNERGETETSVAPTQPETPSTIAASGAMERIARTTSILLVLVLAGAVASSAACTKQQVATGVRAGMRCEEPGIAAAARELYAWAVERIAAAIAGGQVDSTKLRGAMANVIDSSTRCAIEAAVAAAAEPPAGSSLRAADPVDGADLRDAFARAKVDLGW